MTTNASVAINFSVNGVPQTVGQLKQVQQEAENTEKATQANLLQSVGLLSLYFNQLTQSFQTLQALGSQAYGVLIAQNEKLRQEILSTQSSLVANTEIFKDGLRITDTTEAIQALEGPIQEAINRIRKDSLELVGVTSSELTQVFQILATNAASITEQSKQFADPIKAASKLTIDFAASLGTLGVPLFQARQEIQSILQGTIDQNSILAKSLNITNDQVRQWRDQGKLVDELSNKLKPFVEGNALAAKSISGIGSNIQEIIENIQRIGFEPVYAPAVEALGQVYKFLQDNQDELVAGTRTTAEFIIGLAERIGAAIARIAEILEPLAVEIGNLGLDTIQEGGKLAAETLELLASSAVTLFEAASPLIKILTDILSVLNETGIGGPLVVAAIIAALNPVGQLTAAIGLLLNQGVLLVSALNAARLAAIALATQGLGALLTAAAAAVSPLAVIAALAAAIALNFKAIELGTLNEAIAEYDRQVQSAADSSFNLAIQLKEVKKAAEADGKITGAEKERINGLLRQNQARIASNSVLIKSLKDLQATVTNDAQRATITNLIAQLESANRALAAALGQDGGVEVRAKTLANLGNAYKQLEEQAKSAQTQLEKQGGGDLTAAKKAASELIKITQQQLDLGQITTAEARKRFEFIKKQSFLTSEELLAAEKALTDLTKTEGDHRVQIITNQQEQIREEIAKGLISQETGEKRLTKLQIAETEARLANTKRAIAEEKQLRGNLQGSNAQKLLSEQQKLESQLESFRQKAREQQNQSTLKALQEQQTFIERDYAEKRISEAQFIKLQSQARVKALEEQIRQTRESRNRLSQNDMAGRRSLLAAEAKFEKERAEIISQAREQLTKKAIEEVERQTQRLTREIARGVSELDLLTKGLQNETGILQFSNQILDRRRSLYQASLDLEKARGDLAQTRAQGELEQANRVIQIRQQLQDKQIKGTQLEAQLRRELARLSGAQDLSEADALKRKQEAEAKIFRQKVAALNREQEAQRKLFELDQARLAIAAQQELIQAKIALGQAKQAELRQKQQVRQAEGDVKTAQIEYDSAVASGDKEAIKKAKEKLDIAQENLKTQQDLVPLTQQETALAGERVKFAEDGVKTQKQQSAIAKDTLNTQQATQREGLRQEGEKIGFDQRIEAAKANTSSKGITQGDINAIGVSSTPQVGQGSILLSPEAQGVKPGGGFIILPDGKRVDIASQPTGGFLQTPTGGKIPIATPGISPSASTPGYDLLVKILIDGIKDLKKELGRPSVTNEIVNQINGGTDEELVRKFNQTILRTIDNVIPKI